MSNISPAARNLTLGAADAPLRDQVRDDVRQRIVTGELQPGQRIVERELAEQLGVSRIPVREAFRMLESEGFVSVLPRRGVVVSHLSQKDVEELFDVREALEVHAAKRATQLASNAELKRLCRIADRGWRAAESADARKAAECQEKFHDEMIRLAHNDLLAVMVGPLQARMHWLFRQDGDHERLCREHQRLADAIATRDPQRAAEEALEHVQRNRDVSLQLLFGRQGTSSTAQSQGAVRPA